MLMLYWKFLSPIHDLIQNGSESSPRSEGFLICFQYENKLKSLNAQCGNLKSAAYATCRTRPQRCYCASTTISSSVSNARCIISSMQSFKFSSWRLITARFGFVTGCFATKIVQQSSKEGWRSHRYRSFPGNLHDLLLVQPDTRTEYRHGADFIRYREGLDRLARNLSDALTGNQSETFRLFRNVLCDFHHITEHNDRQLIVRALS